MQKLTLIVISLLLTLSLQAQRTYDLQFIKGNLTVVASDSTEILTFKPLSGFSRSGTTFTFNSANSVRQLIYSRIDDVTFDGDTFAHATAFGLADSIDGYLERYQAPTLAGDGTEDATTSTPGLIVRQAPELVKYGPVTTSVSFYAGDNGSVSLNSSGIVGMYFHTVGGTSVLDFDGEIIRLDTLNNPHFKIDPLWDPNCRCWAPIPSVDITPATSSGNGLIVTLYLAQD